MAEAVPLILISNDDGVNAPGLLALRESLDDLGRVVVVAPDRERSAISHALTLHSPLRLQRLEPDRYSITGTPTDCIQLALHSVLGGRRPDLVVSGINTGPNLGDDVNYSGTVAAAREATLVGLPALAVSLSTPIFGMSDGQFDYMHAAGLAKQVAKEILIHGLSPRVLLNLNVPAKWGPQDGVAITSLGKRRYSESILERTDPRGVHYYWICGHVIAAGAPEGTDCAADQQGVASLTPIRLEYTAESEQERLKAWMLGAKG